MDMIEKGNLLHEVIERLYNGEYSIINDKVIFDLNAPISEEWRELSTDKKEKINFINNFFN